MKNWTTGLIAASVGVCAQTVFAAEAAEEAKPDHKVRLATVFTFLDAVMDSGRVWGPEDVDEEMRIAKSLGVDRIYWRVDASRANYPSKVYSSYVWDGRGDASERVVKSIEAIGDPLKAFIEAARKYDLEIYAWLALRDRNGTSERYNPKNPEEKDIYDKVGRWAGLSEFLAKNPHYSMERREQDGSSVEVPEVIALRLKTSLPSSSLEKTDLQIWQSDDNLEYEPVADTWTIEKKTEDGIDIYTISGLQITKPWIKLSSKGRVGWSFGGGSVGEWITTVDKTGREWGPWTWMAPADKNPRFGEAKYPYKPARRSEYTRNDHPWDSIAKFRFDQGGHSIALFTPSMQPERYLLGYPCFAYPEVRAHDVAIIKELLTYPLDGIALSPRTHVRSCQGEDYGFNPPIAAEYEKRHGVNILKEPYDEAKLREIHGDFYTQLLREIAHEVHASNRKLVVLFEPPQELRLDYLPGQMAPWWDIGRTDWQWEKWARENIADELMIFTTGFNIPWDKQLQDYIAEVRQKASGKEVALFYDPDYNPLRQRSSSFTNLVKNALASPNLDELNIFELVEFHDPQQQLYRAVKALKLNEADGASD